MKRAFKITLWSLGIVLIAVCALILAALSMTAGEKLNADKLTLNTGCVEIYDADGREIAQQRQATSLSALPDYLPNAFVAVEDKRFFSHGGVDVKRMLKATLKNLSTFSFREGASTISQQLIKNTHLSGEKTIARKLKEIKLARKLERNYSKSEILELYLNSIYFGHSAFGIGNAARFYFGKEAESLTPAESAMLAALVKSPNRYSPFKDAEKCLARRNFVLSLMAEQGYLTNEESENAKKEPLPEAPQKEESNPFLSSVYEELALKFPDLKSGEAYKVYTAYDAALQETLQQTKADSDVTVLVRDNKKNAVKAFYSTCGLIRRLPASLLKPLAVYAPALEENLISPATPILDEPTDFGGYSPSNYGGSFGGYMSARFALSHSVNVPAVKILSELGLERAEHYLNQMELPLLKADRSLALALGGMQEGYTLLELANAYAVFPNGGAFSPARFILRVENSRGKVLYEADRRRTPVFSEDVAYLMTDMLQTAAREGTAKKLKSLPFPVAAKTGTGANGKNNLDAYTIAYTRDDVVAVWLGNRDNAPIDATGGGLPANIACRILEALYRENPPAPFSSSERVVEIALDSEEYDSNHALVRADPLAPAYLTKKELFRSSCIPNATSVRFSCPKIEKPRISTKNGAVLIELCQTKYYDYVVKRESDGKICTIYSGKYCKTITDNSVRQGVKYTYTVIPVWQGVEGEAVKLPSVCLEQTTTIPDDWWDP